MNIYIVKVIETVLEFCCVICIHVVGGDADDVSMAVLCAQRNMLCNSTTSTSTCFAFNLCIRINV